MPLIKLSSHQIEWIKWLALLAMLLDHIARLLLTENTFLADAFIAFGRLAFPLFAFLLAHNLMHYASSPKRYALWLAAFALLSQPIYMQAFPVPVFNIFATLLVSLGFLLLLQNNKTPRYMALGLAIGLLLFDGAIRTYIDYGSIGILLPAAWWLWLKQPQQNGRVFLLLFALVALNGFQPHSLVGALSLVAVIGIHKQQNLPRILRTPRWFFYSFYPLHIAVLLLFLY